LIPLSSALEFRVAGDQLCPLSLCQRGGKSVGQTQSETRLEVGRGIGQRAGCGMEINRQALKDLPGWPILSRSLRKGGIAPKDRSAAFEILEPVRKGLNVSVQRAKSRGIALVTQFDRGCPLVELGEQGGFNLLEPCANPLRVFLPLAHANCRSKIQPDRNVLSRGRTHHAFQPFSIATL
jgi:hypothetical protein